MKKSIIIFVLLALSACKTTPTTPTSQAESKPTSITSTNEVVTLSKPKTAKLKIESEVNSSIVYLDEGKWKHKKVTKNDDETEYAFDLKNAVVSSKLITEKIPLSKDILAKAAVINAAALDPDVKVVKKEDRIINGNDVVYMEMLASNKDLDFKLFGVYHSNKQGSTQLVVFTLKDLAEDYDEEIQGLLSGFDVASK